MAAVTRGRTPASSVCPALLRVGLRSAGDVGDMKGAQHWAAPSHGLATVQSTRDGAHLFSDFPPYCETCSVLRGKRIWGFFWRRKRSKRWRRGFYQADRACLLLSPQSKREAWPGAGLIASKVMGFRCPCFRTHVSL